MSIKPCHVIKLGGSLLDMPLLAQRVRRVVDAEVHGPVLLVVGGGHVADHVREFDRLHHLGQDAGHRHAVRAMRLNAFLVADILGGTSSVPVIEDLAGFERVIRHDQRGPCVNPSITDGDALMIVDPVTWLRYDQLDGAEVPKDWEYTSDSIAAHVATRTGALRLTLLKSMLPKTECGVGGAVGLGLLDAHFEAASVLIPNIDVVNLRTSPPQRMVLRETA